MLEWLASKLSLRPANPPSAQASATVASARALVAENSLREAENVLRAALRASPSATLGRTLGALYARQERYDEAVDLLSQALQIEPRDAAAANLMGVCLSLTAQYEEAANYYAIACECDPSMAEAHRNSGWNSLLLPRADANDFFREWLFRTQSSRPPLGAPAGRDRPRLDNITLCCIDSAYHALAADALEYTLSRCDFGEALFVSDRDCGVRGVRFVAIEPLTSLAQYSNFVVHRLHQHINSEFVLIIQYDGFVLNPSAWEPGFLDYDYLGARMSVNRRSVVGNGGFSLRSRKLLRALRDDEEIRRYDAHRDPYAEDVAICDTYRERLESRHGIRFAPDAIADRFAAGLTPPTAHTFGFHGLFHLVSLRDNQFAVPEARSATALEIDFRAPTEFGMLVARRQIELRGI